MVNSGRTISPVSRPAEAVQPVSGAREGGIPRYERRRNDRRRDEDSGDAKHMRVLSREIVDSTVEASRALFAGREGQNPSLLRRAASAYGSADSLDRTAVSPLRRVNI